MFRRHFIAASAATAVFAAAFSALPVQAQTIIKATDVHPLGYPTVEALVRMGNKLEKATNGKYKLQMYPSMQLGGEKEMIEQAQVGALQIARISVGPMGTIVDEFNVFNMPFVFKRRSADAQGDRRPDRRPSCSTSSPTARRAWSAWAGWTPARATSTPTSR